MADLQEHVRRLEAELRQATLANSDLHSDLMLMRAQMEEAHAHRQRMMDLVRHAENEVAHDLISTQTTIVEAVEEARSEFRRTMRLHATLDVFLLGSVLVGILVLIRSA